nr:1-acyl-sn-glycerol-3-phosphate acyltransferase 2-like [Ipomoea batatas]
MMKIGGKGRCVAHGRGLRRYSSDSSPSKREMPGGENAIAATHHGHAPSSPTAAIATALHFAVDVDAIAEGGARRKIEKAGGEVTDDHPCEPLLLSLIKERGGNEMEVDVRHCRWGTCCRFCVNVKGRQRRKGLAAELLSLEVKEENNSLPERLTVTEPNSFLCSIGSTRLLLLSRVLKSLLQIFVMEILNLLDGEEIARSVYYFPHSELRPAWGIIFCGMHFRYSGFHSIKTWGASCSFSDIAQKKTKLATLQRQTGTGIGLQEILGRVPLSSKKEKEKALIMTITVDAFCTRFTQAKLLAAQEYATSTCLPVPRNVLIPRIKVLVLGQPGEEVSLQLILRVVELLMLVCLQELVLYAWVLNDRNINAYLSSV